MKKIKNKKITSLVMSLGVATTIAATVAAGIGASEIRNKNEKIVSHNTNIALDINSGYSKTLSGTAQLSQLGITTICKDGNGGFYVGGKNGLFEHFDSNGELLLSKNSKDKISFDITSLTLDSNNGVIISGSNAVQVHLDSEGNTIQDFSLNNAFKMQGAVSKILTSVNGKTYIVGTHGLVSMFDINGLELKTINLGQDVDVNAMIETDDSIVLGAKQGSIFFINKATSEVLSTKVNSSIISIQKNGGGIFVQTQTQSLEISNDNETLNSQNLNIFKNGTINNVVSTKEGYIATGTNGNIALLNEDFKVMTQSVGLEGNTINAIVKDGESGFYIAGEKGLVSHINAKGVEDSEEIKTLLDGSDIYGMQRNDEGHIFVFGNSFKVEELDNQGKTIKHLNLLGISSINTAATKADGEVIFGGEVKTTEVWDTRIESETSSASPLIVTGNPKISNNVTPTSIQQQKNHQIVHKFNFDLKTKAQKTIKPYNTIPDDSSNIVNGNGMQFLQDSHNNLWSVSAGTPLQFSSDGGLTWTVDGHSKILESAHSQTLFEDDHGFIWAMGPTSGLQKFEYDSPTSNTGKWTEQTEAATGSNIKNGSYGFIFQDSRGTLWSMSTKELDWTKRGVMPQRYDYNTKKWIPLDASSKIIPGAFPKMYEDSQHTLWYMCDALAMQKSIDGGNTWIDSGTDITNGYEANVFEDSNGTIWIMGYTKPLRKSLDGGRNFIPAGTGNVITDSAWSTMFEDSRGFLWAMAPSKGLQVSEDGGETWVVQNATMGKSNIIDGTSGTIFEDHLGQLWSIGCGTPLQKYDYIKKEWTTQTEDNSGSLITSGSESHIFEDSQYNLWAAGDNSPLQVKTFESDRWSKTMIHPDIPRTSKITDSTGGSIFEDSQKRMWMMGANATLEMSMDKGATWTQSKGADVAGTGYIFEDKSNKDLYAIITTPRAAVAGPPAVAASEDKIYKLEHGKTDWAEDTSSKITCAGGAAIQDHNGWIWLLSTNNKLQYLEPGKGWVVSTSTIKGGPINGILEDHSNKIWVVGLAETASTIDSGANWIEETNTATPVAGTMPVYLLNTVNFKMGETKTDHMLWYSNGSSGDDFRSMDGGKTWTILHPTGTNGSYFQDTYGNYYSFGKTTTVMTTKDPDASGAIMDSCTVLYYNGWNRDQTVWTPVAGGLVNEVSLNRTFFEDSQGTIWITYSKGVQKSTDKGITWENTPFVVKDGANAKLTEDSEGKVWLFTKGMAPQSLITKLTHPKTLTVNDETKGVVQVNAFMNNFKIHLGFTGVELLKKIGVIVQYQEPSGTWKNLIGSTLGIDKFGNYNFKFIWNTKMHSSLSGSSLPSPFTVNFKDGDGIEDIDIQTQQPKVAGGQGAFTWAPFTNSLHSVLRFSTDGGKNWKDAPETGYNEPASVGWYRVFKYEFDPNYNWNNKPKDPSKETILRVGVGNLETIAPTEIEKHITDWMNGATKFDFTKWTKLSFANSSPGAKQQVVVTTDTKVIATFDIELKATADNKIQYVVTGLSINNGAVIPEDSLPDVFARLKALTHEFTITTGDFEDIKNLVPPVLAKEFPVEADKLPSTVINAKTGASGGTFHYVDPNGVFTIDLTPNNEEGKIHWSALESGAKTPIEGDIKGFYSYDKMSQKVTDKEVLAQVDSALSSFDFTKYTKELFNSSTNRVNQTVPIKFNDANNYYEWDLDVSLKATAQDKIECKIVRFGVKEGTTNLVDASASTKFKNLEVKTLEKTLSKTNQFTTFKEMVAKILKSDPSTIASTSVVSIPKIIKTSIPNSYEFYPSQDYKITFKPDNPGQKVSWEGISTMDPQVSGKGVIGGFEHFAVVTPAQLKTGLLQMKDWYDLSKLPSDSTQPQSGTSYKVMGMQVTIKTEVSDLLGELTINGEYINQLGDKEPMDTIKIFGFKDITSEVTHGSVESAITAKMSDKSGGIFDRTTNDLPSEVYVTTKGGYEIKVLVRYSFSDKKINYQAFIPNGNSGQNTIKVASGTLTGYSSEVEQKIWDPSGVTKLEDTLGDVIKEKLLANNEDHKRLPSEVKTKFSEINMERGFEFANGSVNKGFAGYKSKKINSNYSIVYNSSKDLEIIDTVNGDIVGAPLVIGGNGKIIDAFSYGKEHMIVIEGGTTGNKAIIQFVNLRTASIESEQDVKDISKSGLVSIKQISEGKFIYKDKTGKMHFLLFDPTINKLIADEDAIMSHLNSTDSHNFSVVNISTLNALPNGNFIIVANNKLYEIKIDGIEISIISKKTIGQGSEIKQIGENEFLIKEGTKVYISKYDPVKGFDNSHTGSVPASLNLENLIRVNDEYVLAKDGAIIYKINVKTAKVENISAMIPTTLAPISGSNIFINIGNRGVLYGTNTATGVARILTDGFYKTTVTVPKIDNANGEIEFKVNFLGKTVTYVDKGYYKEIVAPSKDILNYIKVTGDVTNLNIDESKVPTSISDHAHLEYSLDGTKWNTNIDLITFLRTNPTEDILDIQAKYVPDFGYAIQDKKTVKIFEGVHTIDNKDAQNLLKRLVANISVEGSTIKASLSGISPKLFADALKTDGMKLMVNIDNTGWIPFDITNPEIDIPQTFDANGKKVAPGKGVNTFDELYDRSKLSVSLKLFPTASGTRLALQNSIETDLSNIKVLIHTTVTDVKAAQSNVIVKGESGSLVFDSSKALDGFTQGKSNVVIKYSLTGGEAPTEEMLRDIFSLTKTYSSGKMQNLMQMFTQYNWFTETEYKNNIEGQLKGMNINAESIWTKFDSKIPNTALEANIAAPFKTSGTIIVFHDVSELKNKIIDLKDGLVNSGGSLQVQLPNELLPRVLAQYGALGKTRDGKDTVSDDTFGIALQYTLKANPTAEADWITIKGLKGNTFIIPGTATITNLQMRLKPIKVVKGIVSDWNKIDDSTDRTLVSDPANPKVQSTTGVDVSLHNVKVIKAITLASPITFDNLHFNLEGSSKNLAEPKMPTYRFVGEENGNINVAIQKNGIPATTDVFVQWIRPTRDTNGIKDGYEMYTGEKNGVAIWIKVADINGGKLVWSSNDYNNLPGSWVDPNSIKTLSVGDHIRFRLHAVTGNDQFLWKDTTVNYLSELVYSSNDKPLTSQDDSGSVIQKIVINPFVEASRVKLTFVSPNAKDDPKDLSAIIKNSVEPKPTAKWMWHYTVIDGKTKVGEYDKTIPEDVLKQGMIIKMKVVSINDEAYELDSKAPNAFKDVIVEWPIRLTEKEFKFDGKSGFAKLITTLPSAIKDAKLLYRIIDAKNNVGVLIDVAPEKLSNGEKVEITIDPLNKNKLLVPDQKLIIKVTGLVEPTISETNKIEGIKPLVAPKITPVVTPPKPVAPTNLPNGMLVKPDGTIVKPDGTIIKPNEIKTLKDGTKVLPDKTQIKTDGTVIKPDGTVLKPILPVIKTPTTNIEKQKVVDTKTDGAQIIEGKTIVLKDGTKILPNGTIVSPEKSRSGLIKIVAISSGVFVSILTGSFLFAFLKRRKKND